MLFVHNRVYRWDGAGIGKTGVGTEWGWDRCSGDGEGIGRSTVGMTTSFWMRGGDGDELLSPCYSLVEA